MQPTIAFRNKAFAFLSFDAIIVMQTLAHYTQLMLISAPFIWSIICESL